MRARTGLTGLPTGLRRTIVDQRSGFTEVQTAQAVCGLGRHVRNCRLVISGSRPEWLASDLASLALGAVTCPIHPAESTDTIGFMLRNVEATVVLVESRQQLAKLEEVRAEPVKPGIEDCFMAFMRRSAQPAADQAPAS